MSTPARMTVTDSGGAVWERTDETSVIAAIRLSRERMSTSSIRVRVGMIHLDGAPSKPCLGGIVPEKRIVWQGVTEAAGARFERTGILTMRVACASKTTAQAE